MTSTSIKQRISTEQRMFHIPMILIVSELHPCNHVEECTYLSHMFMTMMLVMVD